MNNRFDDTFTGKLLRFWPIVIAIVIFISAWSRVNYSLSIVEKDTKSHEQSDNIIAQNHESRLTVLETTNKEIIRRLDRIEVKIDRLR